MATSAAHTSVWPQHSSHSYPLDHAIISRSERIDIPIINTSAARRVLTSPINPTNRQSRPTVERAVVGSNDHDSRVVK